MPVGRLDHYSIRTLDIEASRRFYTEVMGFEVGFRPQFDFPGLWLYNGARYPESYGVVHIIGVDLNNPEGLKEYLGDRDLATLNGTGTVDHMAFAATGLTDMRLRLQRLEQFRVRDDAGAAAGELLACLLEDFDVPARPRQQIGTKEPTQGSSNY